MVSSLVIRYEAWHFQWLATGALLIGQERPDLPPEAQPFVELPPAVAIRLLGLPPEQAALLIEVHRLRKLTAWMETPRATEDDGAAAPPLW